VLIVTIAARNYLPQVRVLARSFLAHHPEGRVAALVLDAIAANVASEPFEVITLRDLPLERNELHLMQAIYGVTELATAIKPTLLRHLLARGEEAVTYLDPDIEVFGPLDDLDALAREHAIVLTPHRLGPPPDDGLQPDEHVFVQAGSFNLGFVAVSPAAAPFVEWWADRCRRDCLHEVGRGLFVDQRWVDVATAYFDHHVVRDAGCNVAYWNVDERPLTVDSARYYAGDAPLRFFHYSGYEPNAPTLTRHHGGRPRVLLSDRPALRELCARYGDQLRGEGWDECTALDYGLDRAANGMRIDHAARRAFREELLRRERGTDADRAIVEPLGDPFDPEGVDDYVALLRASAPGSDLPRISRYLLALHRSREDVQRAFPDLVGLAGNHYVWWMREMGGAELGIPPELLPSEADLEPPAEPYHPHRQGVRVVGYFAAELGIGELGRSMVAILEELGEPHSVVYERGTANRQQHGDVEPRANRLSEPDGDFDVNLVCVNADRLPVVLDRLGTNFGRHRRTIGVWAWEVEQFPSWMAGAAALVDEVWAPSAFAAEAIRRAIDKPVHAVPPPVLELPVPARDRRSLGLPDGFVFLFCFDFFSVGQRKNPSGLVDAFCRAFPPGEGPQLVIKSINGASSIVESERLRLRALGRDDVHLVDGYLDPANQRALIRACDAYVSLHRAEGFGFTLAEAMLAAKPVIGTGYSGNLEFMDETNSFLVDYALAPIPRDCGPYPEGAGWAEPDLEHAALLLRRVVEDPAGAAVVAERGRRTIVEQHSPRARVPLVAARLATVRAAAEDASRTWIAPTPRFARVRRKLAHYLGAPPA
jgi:glycosyltransferase involved in cell wall biosynthesis